MKKLIKALAVLAIVLIVVVLATQLFLNRGLNPVIQKALPEASEALGVDLGVGNASISLFAGSMAVDAVSVANPEAFEGPTAFSLDRTVLDVGLRSLSKGILEVSEASVENATLTLIRNQEGDMNLTKIQEALPRAEESEAVPTPEKETPPPASKPFTMPKVQLNALTFNMLLEYIDYKTTNATPNNIGLDLLIEAADVTTFGSRPESEWGTLLIRGNLCDSPEDFVTDITARIAPLSDPAMATFSAVGNIVAIDMTEFGEETMNEVGVTSSSADIALNIKVCEGAFMSGSALIVTLRNAELTGDLKAKHESVTLPPDLSLTIPISGTLAKPAVYLHQAITASILRNLVQNPDYILDNVTVGGKSLRERLGSALGGDSDETSGSETNANTSLNKSVDSAVKQLGDLFK
jgi:uncharacterized protein involved in outer membrane biogenesis